MDKEAVKESFIWSTPRPIFDALHRMFQFDVDLCADADNAKLPKFHLREHALSLPWKERGFLNPPYGDGIEEWVAKAREDANEYGVTHVCFIPGRTNPPWWHEHIMRASEVWCVKRKVSFVEPGGKKGVPPYGLTVAIFHNGTESIGGTMFRSWDWKLPGGPKYSCVLRPEFRMQ